MADDILLSPEEQDERARQWLKDNAFSLFFGVAIGIGVIYGINFYRAQEQSNAEQASSLYQNVMSSVTASDQTDITPYIEDLKANHGKSIYASKAVLIQAKSLANSDLPAAAAALQWVVANSPERGVSHAARLRLIKALIAQSKLDEASKLANHAAVDGFQSNYNESLGDIAIAKGELDKAKEYYQKSIDSLSQGDQAYKSILTLKLNQIVQ